MDINLLGGFHVTIGMAMLIQVIRQPIQAPTRTAFLLISHFA